MKLGLGWKGTVLWALSRPGRYQAFVLQMPGRVVLPGVPGVQPKHGPVRWAGPAQARTIPGRAIFWPDPKPCFGTGHRAERCMLIFKGILGCAPIFFYEYIRQLIFYLERL